MRIAVITLLWRNETFAAAFLRTLAESAEQAGSHVEVIALQNGPDGAAASAALEQAAAGRAAVELRLERTADNLGFAGGMNIGCRATDAEVLVIANLDLEFDRDFVSVLESEARALTGLAFLAPSVGSPPGSTAEAAARETGALRRDWLHRPSKSRSIPSEGQPVPAGNGSCVVLGRRLYAVRASAVGGLFDAEYHSYYEDVDLFWWAERQNIPIWFVPQLRVIHHQGGSFEGKFRFRDRTPDVQSSVMANYRLTVWKNATGPLDVLGWVVGEAGYLARCLRISPRAGLLTYVESWAKAWTRASHIRRRRGSLRVRRQR